MKSDDEIMFSRFRNVALENPHRSEQFKAFVRARGPHGAEFHHVFGSVHGLKSTDMLGVAVTHSEHMEGELNKDWIIEQAPGAIRNLIAYAIWQEEEIKRLKRKKA